MMTTDETTKFETDALCVLVGPMLHAATVTHLKIMFLTNVLTKQFEHPTTAYSYGCIYVKSNDHT